VALPVLFVCENNLYAMGTALERAEAEETDLARKAASYGMPAEAVDGMDVVAVEEAARARSRGPRGRRPAFLECRTYRFRAHSMFDPELYRDKEEVEEWKRARPDPALHARGCGAGRCSTRELARSRPRSSRDRRAVAFAEAGTWEPVEDLLRRTSSASVTDETPASRAAARP
jgi:pyruvate dehydrogenase E1 component alpha subunit